jgi:citrate synthase
VRLQYLSAPEAAARLGVSRGSLYSYVSRGRLRAEPDPHDSRVSRYVSDDVERLRERKEARRHPEAAARRTLDMGLPVLESALTLIDKGRIYYRGRDVAALARRARFEDVVRLLWEDDTREPRLAAMSPVCRETLSQLRALPAIRRMQAILPIAAAEDLTAFDTGREHVMKSGWRALALLAAAATGRDSNRAANVADALVDGWHVRHRSGRRLLDMALILCADHELNVSAFTARVVASARSSPYDVVGAGLAALRGPLHGGHTTRVEALLDEAGSPRCLHAAIAARVRKGETVPGFGHPLYPRGDPRARALLSAVRRLWPSSEPTMFARALQRSGRTLLGEHATIDVALVILRRALALPGDAALTIFALGRTAGWIAHAIEQYERHQLIRPRAAYTGVPPRR